MKAMSRFNPTVRDVAAAATGTVVCSSPVFLLGALAVQMRSSLHFGAQELGVVVAAYYLGAGASSVTLGRLTESVGGLRTMRLAILVSSASLLTLAVAVRSVPALGVVMVVAGISSAAMQPASNLFLARRVPASRQGLAFGLKQSAVPMAALLAGLSVPAVALTVGWRWAFALAGLLAALTGAWLPRPTRTLAELRAARVTAEPTPLERLPLAVLTIGFGLGVGAASALAAFLVSSAVSGGLGRGEAGLLAAFGGAVAVVSRILNGLRADRRGRAHLAVVSAMLVLGALGYAGLGLESAHRIHLLYLPAVAVVYGAGWGWNGLFNFAVVKNHPERPAAATGLTQVGGRLGGVLGPFLFGQAVAHGSYAVAWLATAATTLLAAGVIFVGRQLLLATRRPAAG